MDVEDDMELNVETYSTHYINYFRWKDVLLRIKAMQELTPLDAVLLADGFDVTGHKVWPGAFLLLAYLASNERDILRNKTVIELGAGPGLCGIFASMFSRQTLLTDGDADVVELLNGNSKLNHGNQQTHPHRATTRILQWGEEADSHGSKGLFHPSEFRPNSDTFSSQPPPPAGMSWRPEFECGFDVLLASDVVYDAEAVPLLLHTAARLMRRRRDLRGVESSTPTVSSHTSSSTDSATGLTCSGQQSEGERQDQRSGGGGGYAPSVFLLGQVPRCLGVQEGGGGGEGGVEGFMVREGARVGLCCERVDADVCFETVLEQLRQGGGGGEGGEKGGVLATEEVNQEVGGSDCEQQQQIKQERDDSSRGGAEGVEVEDLAKVFGRVQEELRGAGACILVFTLVSEEDN